MHRLTWEISWNVCMSHDDCIIRAIVFGGIKMNSDRNFMKFNNNFWNFLEELCRPSPCGANTKCDVIGGKFLRIIIFQQRKLTFCNIPRPTDLLMPSHLHWLAFIRMQTRMRIRQPVRIARTLQQLEVHESLWTVRKGSHMFQCRQPSCSLWMSKRLHRIAINWMSPRMLRRCWLPRIKTRLFLWNLQEPMWWCMWCERWLQPPWIDANLQLSKRSV